MNIERLDEKTLQIECDMCEGTHLFKSCEGPPDPSEHFALVGDEGADSECVLCAQCKHVLPQAIKFLNEKRGKRIKEEELRPLTVDRVPSPPKANDAEPVAK